MPDRQAALAGLNGFNMACCNTDSVGERAGAQAVHAAQFQKAFAYIAVHRCSVHGRIPQSIEHRGYQPNSAGCDKDPLKGSGAQVLAEAWTYLHHPDEFLPDIGTGVPLTRTMKFDRPLS